MIGSALRKEPEWLELDLLLLLESLHDIHHQPSAASLENGSVINEHDVSVAELVCAARTFLEETVIANAQGAEKFHARLAKKRALNRRANPAQ